MDLMWFIYLAGIADKLEAVVTVLFILSILGGIALPIIGYAEDCKFLKKLGLISLCSSVLFCLLLIVVPSSKTLYLMLGVSKGQELFKEYKGNEILDKANKLILKNLDEMLQEKK